MGKIARKIRITGLVQGVGFRPYIYRLANHHGISGWVINRTDGVTISAEGDRDAMDNFIRDIPQKAPHASSIHEINMEEKRFEGQPGFVIRKSDGNASEVTEISPDIAVCELCLQDLKEQKHRLNYPFINCTNCGPRFTIIKDLPYDRRMTTMEPFGMCDECRREYENVEDRRFHAQPVACKDCGPHYVLRSGDLNVKGTGAILKTTAGLITEGKIVAIKGLGGYHLACDALNDQAVKKLRRNKIRDGKPFAVMFRDLEAARSFTKVSNEEEKALTSWRRPIVILENDPAGKRLAADISVGFGTTGGMLPYMPFHFQLFEELQTPAIVLTSGNISEEPVIIDDEAARIKLGDIADAILSYNREIHNRADDSVMIFINGDVQMIRRSRGFVPSPTRLQIDTEGIIAAGAELVNCFCIGKGHEAMMSQHIGDLRNLETLEFYSEALERFKRMFRVDPQLIVHDMHPDYLSTRYALEQVEKAGIAVAAVQHHHAHVASCMAENALDEPVIGVSFDGIGLGDDGHIWGGEFFIADLEKYDRKYHFEYVSAPGGDMVTKQPWRMAVSYLRLALGHDYRNRGFDFLAGLDPDQIDLLESSIDKKINAPLTSSAGRLFDAVAAFINLCPVSSFHAEAPMRLESIADKHIDSFYHYDIDNSVISFRNTFAEIAKDLMEGTDLSAISARFHNTIVEVIRDVALRLRDEYGIRKAALSGGTFQNRIITGRASRSLRDLGFEVYTQQKVPANDGGIALGQLAIAAKRRSLGKIKNE